jgi:NAD(P)-dependent dehydrogenase (short-subunit alcohol dehydrogenase family)
MSKTVLITGGSSGMGKETAKKLLSDGYTVYVAARRVDRMADLENLGATALAMDISKDEEIVAAVERITSETGGVDVLVNNAGFGSYGAMEDTSLEDARYQFEVNLFGLARLTQLVLPHMREKKAGRIINISSMGGKIYTPLGSWYHATKHALEGWSDCLRIEVASFGIDVVIIEPGAIDTEWSGIMVDQMMERSGDGPYSDQAKRMADAAGDGGSPVSVIADVIVKSVKVKKPKTRYSAGKYAKQLLALRKLTSDRMFDRIIKSQI